MHYVCVRVCIWCMCECIGMCMYVQVYICVCVCVFIYLCMYKFVCKYACIVCMRVYMFVWCVYVYGCIPVRVYICVHVSSCVLRGTVIQTRFVRFGPIAGDLVWCSLWTQQLGDSKTDTRANSKIRTGSCSEDQMAIRIQNRVISCEGLLLCYYLFTIVNDCCMITRINLCE